MPYPMIYLVQQNSKGVIQMKCYTINRQWFEEIKNRVPHNNVYIYSQALGSSEIEFVEADFDDELFNAVSTELGWM